MFPFAPGGFPLLAVLGLGLLAIYWLGVAGLGVWLARTLAASSAARRP